MADTTVCLDSIDQTKRWNSSSTHWPFQETKLQVPTMCKAYVRAKFQGICPENMALVQYLHLLDLEDLPSIYVESWNPRISIGCNSLINRWAYHSWEHIPDNYKSVYIMINMLYDSVYYI